MAMTMTEYLLICLMEEASELQQAAAKALRFGLFNHHPDKPHITNKAQLEKETGYLFGVVDMLSDIGDIDSRAIGLFRSEKPEKVKAWMNASRDEDILEDKL